MAKADRAYISVPLETGKPVSITVPFQNGSRFIGAIPFEEMTSFFAKIRECFGEAEVTVICKEFGLEHFESC